jgi:hypothetical protein
MAEHLDITPKMISRILYSDYEPRLNIKVRFEVLFGIPHNLLFNKGYRAGGAN